MPYEAEGILHVDADELKAILSDPDKQTIVIDVREPFEYIEGHIPGVPLIPMGEIPAYLHRLDKQKEYVFVCRSGNRSLLVAQFLKHNGFDKVCNLAGGMLGWAYEIETGAEHIVDPSNPQGLGRGSEQPDP